VYVPAGQVEHPLPLAEEKVPKAQAEQAEPAEDEPVPAAQAPQVARELAPERVPVLTAQAEQTKSPITSL